MEQGKSGLQEAVEIFVKNEPSVVFECGGCGKEISRLHGMLKADSLRGVFDAGSGEQAWRPAEPLLADPDIKVHCRRKDGKGFRDTSPEGHGERGRTDHFSAGGHAGFRGILEMAGSRMEISFLTASIFSF